MNKESRVKLFFLEWKRMSFEHSWHISAGRWKIGEEKIGQLVVIKNFNAALMHSALKQKSADTRPV